jgi:predicted phage tail protein
MLAILAPLASLLRLELSAIQARIKRQAVLWGTLGVLGLVAATFVLVSINTALTFAVGPVVAPLIIAGAALLIGIIVFLVFHLRETMEARQEAERKHNAEVTALVTTAAITALPLILPTLKKVGVPAGSALAAAYSLFGSRHGKRS